MARNIREKAERRREEKDNRPKAIARYIRVSPSKVNIVLKLIRGKKFADAKATLINSVDACATTILKVLNSAGANAENNLGMNTDDLYVATAIVSDGPMIKRMMPRAKGRADRILKKTSHITVILDTVKGE